MYKACTWYATCGNSVNKLIHVDKCVHSIHITMKIRSSTITGGGVRNPEDIEPNKRDATSRR